MPILAGAAAVSALAWAYLLAAHGGYWRTDQRLPPGARDTSRDPARWPSVMAVVPARDEAAILPATLPSLLAQDYPGEFSVVLVDDASTDGTAAAAAELAAGLSQSKSYTLSVRVLAGRLNRSAVAAILALPSPNLVHCRSCQFCERFDDPLSSEVEESRAIIDLPSSSQFQKKHLFPV